MDVKDDDGKIKIEMDHDEAIKGYAVIQVMKALVSETRRALVLIGKVGDKASREIVFDCMRRVREMEKAIEQMKPEDLKKPTASKRQATKSTRY